jgi:hypothetical protein
MRASSSGAAKHQLQRNEGQPSFYIAQVFVHPGFRLDSQTGADSRQGYSTPLALPLIVRLPEGATASVAVRLALERFSEHMTHQDGAATASDRTDLGESLLATSFSTSKPVSPTALMPVGEVIPSTYLEDYSLLLSDGEGHPLHRAETTPLPSNGILKEQPEVLFPFMFVLVFNRYLGSSKPSLPIEPASLSSTSAGSDVLPVIISQSDVSKLHILTGGTPSVVPKTESEVLSALVATMTKRKAEVEARLRASAQATSSSEAELANTVSGKTETKGQMENSQRRTTLAQSSNSNAHPQTDDGMNPDALRRALGISHYDIARFGYGNSQSISKVLSRQQSLEASKAYVQLERVRNIARIEAKRIENERLRMTECGKKLKSLREETMEKEKAEKELLEKTSLQEAAEKDAYLREQKRRALELEAELAKAKAKLEEEERDAAARRSKLEPALDSLLVQRARGRNRALEATVNASATIEAESRRMGPMMGKLNETRPVLKRVDERVRQARSLDNLISQLNGEIVVDSSAASDLQKSGVTERVTLAEQREELSIVKEAELQKRLRTSLLKSREKRETDEVQNKKLDESLVVQYARAREREAQALLAPFSLTQESISQHLESSTNESDAAFLRWREERMAAAEAAIARKELCAERRVPNF